MQYQEAVAEARRLVKRSEDDQWRLAQLTYEQVLAGISQAQWCRDTGMGRNHVSVLVRMWGRYGLLGQDRPRFTEAYGLVNAPDRVQEDGTESIGRAKSTVRNLPPEEKAAVVREALDDQDVAVRVLRDPHTRRNVTDARQRVVEEIESSNRDREQANPVGQAVREATLELEIENDAYAARYKLAEVARKLMDLEARDPAVAHRLEGVLSEVETALAWARTALRGGRVDDEALVRLLEEGGA